MKSICEECNEIIEGEVVVCEECGDEFCKECADNGACIDNDDEFENQTLCFNCR